MRTVKSCGRGPPTLGSTFGSKSPGGRRLTSPVLRREREVSRKPLRRECRSDFGVPVLDCVRLFVLHAWQWVRRAPGIPCALCFSRTRRSKPRTRERAAGTRKRALHSLVIPGRASWREPGIHNHRRPLLEALLTSTQTMKACGYGFRAQPCGLPRNDRPEMAIVRFRGRRHRMLFNMWTTRRGKRRTARTHAFGNWLAGSAAQWS